MIIVTGAGGQLGRAVVERLLTRVPAGQLGVSVRDPGKAAELEESGVRVRRGDFLDPGSLAHSFEGASRILLVSVGRTGESALRAHRAAVEAAASAGADHLFYTSHQAAGAASAFSPMHTHAATERLLRESGLPWTSLRNGFYASFAAALLPAALESGELVLPEDGPVSWTAHADLAEAAAVALTEDGPQGPTPGLTGAEALDMAEVAVLASELAGRPIRRVVVPDSVYRESLRAQGLPEEAAELYLGMFAASRAGEFAEVGPELPKRVGRPATTMREVLAAALPAAH
ncbi:NAD(P)H-binding protein [Streptomyces physcomitrii]|uniref:NAD(P)H-binding protein n=1 Tax=Streptomyces physcomitrii TaxID=2724184 RepID=A0ABX1GYP8_9ACTN|nr:NAD(P)H-binding protein [Streptomyces physcomitrii]NKI41207.1 NAD(P)H-binding protein [Streptomyces physcomitrii]